MSEKITYVAKSDQYYIDYLNNNIKKIFRNHRSKNKDRIEFGCIIIDDYELAILAIDNQEKQWVMFKIHGKNKRIIKNPKSKELQEIENNKYV